MAKSKNRKDHNKKVLQRRTKMNEAKNTQKKQVQAWIETLKKRAAEQQAQSIIDVDPNAKPISVGDEKSIAEAVSQPPEEVGSSGQL